MKQLKVPLIKGNYNVLRAQVKSYLLGEILTTSPLDHSLLAAGEEIKAFSAHSIRKLLLNNSPPTKKVFIKEIRFLEDSLKTLHKKYRIKEDFLSFIYFLAHQKRTPSYTSFSDYKKLFFYKDLLILLRSYMFYKRFPNPHATYQINIKDKAFCSLCRTPIRDKMLIRHSQAKIHKFSPAKYFKFSCSTASHLIKTAESLILQAKKYLKAIYARHLFIPKKHIEISPFPGSFLHQPNPTQYNAHPPSPCNSESLPLEPSILSYISVSPIKPKSSHPFSCELCNSHFSFEQQYIKHFKNHVHIKALKSLQINDPQNYEGIPTKEGVLLRKALYR
ncbi:hypothetical protein NEFER03_1299 [Nematocida sp. LUAm3]|nr:hypothetical protein NEFER03_1299 [Nematocida sp. LUAm3]KAI5174079.1 hypothetical protein NEFER02_0546 [Nematocida sp. LUAm2]KAI5177178.1 hypothetical protein NEFER01_0453 [Nematocida sp. LUAm1]